jgi:hypothetical protein
LVDGNGELTLWWFLGVDVVFSKCEKIRRLTLGLESTATGAFDAIFGIVKIQPEVHVPVDDNNDSLIR